MKITRTALAAATTFLALAVLSESSAYRMIQNSTIGRVTAGFAVPCNDPGGFAHWATSSSSWWHNTAGQGSGKAAALQAAMSSWTSVGGASHALTYAGTTSAGFVTDGINATVWANGNGCVGNCLALTALVLQANQTIVESDVTFNESYTWTTNGANYDTQSVATHEFGHALGLHHTEVTGSPLPTMYATYFGADARSLQNDDQDGLRCSEATYPFPIPADPVLSQNVVDSCHETINISYTASSGATTYELWQSDTGASYSQIYSGPYNSPTDVYVSYYSSPDYLKARACNLIGCSAFSNVLGIRYQATCS